MVGVLASSWLGCGCATLGSYQTADTVGRGNWEGAIEPTLGGGGAAGEPVFGPHVDVAVRAGVSDRMDVGGRFGSSGLHLSLKLMLTDADADGVILSLAPAAGGFLLPGVFIDRDRPFGVLDLNLPVLVGIPTTNRSQVVIGPRAVSMTWFVGSESKSVVLLGSSFGFHTRTSSGLQLVPELTVAKPLTEVDGDLFLEAGLGIGFGRRS